MTSTPHEPRLASVAALIADPARSRMLCFLLSGDYASAGELARAASVTPATASEHLAKLLGAKLVCDERRGRHRYFRLADDDVAHALEAMALVAERSSHASTWASPARSRLRYARCCYGHLAGRLGVELFGHMQDHQWLQPQADGLALTDEGVVGLGAWGVAIELGAKSKRQAYPCLDWSERRDHLGGPLAKQVLTQWLELGWLRRHAGERALELSPIGRQKLGPILPSTNKL